MKKLLLASLALCAATAMHGAALAADMPVKPVYKAPPPVAEWSWTGFYVGANGGYGWHGRTVAFTGNDTLTQGGGGALGINLPASISFDARGGFGGVQFGYNWQVARSWLIGFETDFDGSRIVGSGSATALVVVGLAPTIPAAVTAEQNLKWFGTVRGRLGFLPVNNLLLYGTGGLAYGRVTEAVSLGSAGLNGVSFGIGGSPVGFACTAGDCFAGSSTRTAVGWTAGGGFELALWDRVSIKSEYLFVHLGHSDSVNTVALNTNGALTAASFTAAYSDLNVHIARVGINYRFGDAAVAAKY